MRNLTIIDAYSHFPVFWERVKNLSLDSQIAQWASEYIAPWPDLKSKLILSTEEDGPWRTVAKEHVFPKFHSNAELFLTGGKNLHSIIPEVVWISQEKFAIDYPMVVVIYVGIGVGAGWATTFRGMPAVLFGLENLIECGWIKPDTLKALAAHEFGHLIHYQWRNNPQILPESTSPLWQLYEEGFAMRLEHEIMGYPSWHEQMGQKNWVKWCTNNIGRLARIFLDSYHMKSEDVIRKFFGSWYEIEGKKQTGYYLGHEIIVELEKEFSLKEIGKFPLNKIEKLVEKTLETRAI